MLSRHGFSTWGLLGAVCALLWGTTTEVLNASHNWTDVLLVQLAGGWLLGFISSPWAKALGLWNIKGKARTLRELVLRVGITEENILFSVLHAAIMLGISIYLGFKGFVLLSVCTSATYLLVLPFMAFAGVALRVKLPVRLSVQPTKPKRQSKYSWILARLLVLAIALASLDAVRSVWPIDKPDIRLGLLLAALSSIWGVSLFIIRPPATAESLRELRSELAFGEMDAEEARTKALYILRGTTDEYYLTSKAEEAAAELGESCRLYKSLSDQVLQVVPLAEKLKASNSSDAVLKAVSREFRTLFNAIRANTDAVDTHMRRAAELRVQLLKRIEAAEVFLNLGPEVGKGIVQRLDAPLQQVEASRRAFAKAANEETFKPAFDFLCTAQRDLKLPRNQTPYQLVRTCIRD